MVTKIKLVGDSIRCLLLFSALFTSNLSIAQTAVYDLDISAQNTANALNFLAKKTGETFLFSYDLAEKSQSRAVRGQYDIKTALSKLLKGTGLVANIADDGALVIVSSKEGDTTTNNEGNKMNRKRNLLVTALASIFALNATADENTASSQVRQLEEITVTAQKREQSINDVGLSITAADAEQLANAGIYDVGDLAKIVPGMTTSSNLMGSPTITLRGIGFNGFTLGSSPAVSVYVDQVATPFMLMARGVSLDLERVEVLKGPQGILFGQNSTGGAVNYIAAKPTEEFEGGISGTYGSYGETHVDGYLSGAVSDTLSARLAVRTDQGGAWQKNYTRSDELGDKDFTAARLLVNWAASDDVNVLFNLNGWQDKSDSLAPQLQGIRLQSESFPQSVARGALIAALPIAPNNARAANWEDDNKNVHDDHYFQASVRVDVNLSDELTLTSITSYDDYKQDYSLDRDGTDLDLINVSSNFGEIDNFSQEIRLAGDSDKMHWLIGANYMKADTFNLTSIQLGDSTNTVVPTNDDFGLFGGAFGFFEASDSFGGHDIEEYAVFGNIDYQATDRVTLSAGLRYTNNEKKYESCTTGDASITATMSLISTGNTNPFLVTPGDCVSLDSVTFEPGLFKDTLEEDNVSWRLGVNYQPTDDLMVYANVTQGFKSGSFPVLSAPFADALKPTTQEEVLAYEIGFKMSMVDAAVQLNGALFYYDYSDKQVRGNIVVPIFGTLENLVNVPESHVQGAEIQLMALPMEGLTVSLSATYLDTNVDKYIGLDGDGVNRDLSDSIIPFTPDWQAVADVEYRFAVGDGMEAFVGGSATHNSATNSSIGEPSRGAIREFTVLDLRAGVVSADGTWQVTAFGRNITDEYYWNNNFASQDVIVRFAAKPVTYGVKIDYNF